ncbi:serine/threonine-protein phosphatase [Streptomyces pactum]|uniref:Serine/threonine-protein phosphatase n=1 Tax=Streptomyces pactum TaxID=68249 RepID=A0ABS0NLL3_9ACTN|nr:PP2C family serine/threonine-protein phosphatase [Streptomyces pactum]MBH5336089.1 serine/threonine-protein phosphatase [Streptomyces pactum]
MPYTAVTALSHPGLVRDHNEDSLTAGPWTLCGTVTETPQTLVFPLGAPLVVAVADGLGGQPAGEVASALVARRLAALGPALDGEDAVRDAVKLCNHAVYVTADGAPELTGMGTTVAGLVIAEGEALAFNVGDSRVYDAGPDGLRRLSVDDNPPLPPGRRTTPVVTQTLGGGTAFRPVTPHLATAGAAPGDRFLVCSDGLTDPVPDEALGELLRVYDDGRAAFELWKAAIEAGGPDNITLAVVRIGA